MASGVVAFLPPLHGASTVSTGRVNYGTNHLGEKRISVAFYRAASEIQPVRAWLLSLDDADRRTIGRDIQRLEFEWPVGMPYCRPLGHSLWEVRSRISDGRIARVIFCMSDGRLYLLHGFIKKTQKTPAGEIELALRRMKEGQT